MLLPGEPIPVSSSSLTVIAGSVYPLFSKKGSARGLVSRFWLAIAAAAACLFLAPTRLLGQSGPENGSILVRVRLPDGSSLDRGVIVNLFTLTGASVGI